MPKAKSQKHAFKNYRSGDPASFDLLWNSVDAGTVRPSANSEKILTVIPPTSFLLVIPRGFPVHSAAEWGPSMAVKTAFHNFAKERFPIAKKGFVLTTTYASSIMASLDHYFKMASRVGRKQAFRSFQKTVKQAYSARRMLTRYNSKLQHTNHLQTRQVLAQLKRFKNKEVFQTLTIGNFIHSLGHYCGSAPCPEDFHEFRRMKNWLERSSSMEDLLSKFEFQKTTMNLRKAGNG